MQVILKGNFVKNTEIKRKDGGIIPIAIVLAGDETVQINNLHFDSKIQPLAPIEIEVNVKSSQYGLYITPVQK